MGPYIARLPALWRRITTIAPALSIAAGFVLLALMLPQPANAILGGLAATLAEILLWFAKFLGELVLTLIGILIEVARYNDFINAPAVVKGWVIVRDVSNMFFVIILLLIAFGSVFRIEEYQYKKLLGKLLIMAVLVNFSKSITGLFIDIAQVVMLTFVNGFKDAAAGNFISGFHLEELFQFATTGQSTLENADTTAFLSAAALALISVIITLIVVLVYLLVFIMRIVALWFLTIISPIAYVLSAFPGDAKKYSSMWWDYFGKYVTTGPILAFFLWLSLAVMQLEQSALGDFKLQQPGQLGIPGATITKIGQADTLLSFIVNIILLMGGLWMTQQLGVAGGGLAGKAFNKIQGAGAAIAKAPFRLVGGAAGWGAGRLWGTAKYEYSKLTTKLMEGKEGKEPGKMRKAAFAVLNAPATVRGWEARTKELESEQKEIASAYGREVTEQLRTGGRLKIPYSTFVERKHENEYMKEYQNMSKEIFMHSAVELEKMTGPEADRRKRAIVKAAASQGYLDDLMRMPEFAKKYAIGNTLYNEKTLNRFLYGYLGESRETMRLLDQDLDTLGKQTRHWEYLGHAGYDPRTGNYTRQMKEIKDEKGNVIDMEDIGQRTYAIGELKKAGGRDRIATAPHNELSQVADRYEEDELDDKGNVIHEKGDFKLSPEGTVDIRWGISEGGRTDFQKAVSEATSDFGTLREKQHSQARLKYTLLSEDYDDLHNEVVVHSDEEFGKIKTLYDEMPGKMLGMFQLLSRKETAQGFVVRVDKPDGTVERHSFGNYLVRNEPQIGSEVAAELDQDKSLEDEAYKGKREDKVAAVTQVVNGIREAEVVTVEDIKKRLADKGSLFGIPEEPKKPVESAEDRARPPEERERLRKAREETYQEDMKKYNDKLAQIQPKIDALANKIAEVYADKRAEFFEFERYFSETNPAWHGSSEDMPAALGPADFRELAHTIQDALRQGFASVLQQKHPINSPPAQDVMIAQVKSAVNNLIQTNEDLKRKLVDKNGNRYRMLDHTLTRLVRAFLPSKITS